MSDEVNFRLVKLEDGHRLLGERQTRLELKHERLSKDLEEIKHTLERSATKDDLNEIKQHFDASLNSLLKEALNAIPGRLVAICVIIGTILTLFNYFHGK